MMPILADDDALFSRWYWTYAKWLETIKMAFARFTAYKSSFFLLVIGPGLVFLLIKYQLWSTILAAPAAHVGAYDLKAMLSYQCWVMIVALMSQGYNSINLSEDIRLGRISSYLIYPFAFWEFHSAGFIAFQTIQFGIVCFTLFLLKVFGFVVLPPLSALVLGTIVCQLVGILWFIVAFMVGIAAFWLEETWVLRVIFGTVVQFLSGAVMPLELFPPWLAKALVYTPFPYMAWLPTKVFLGETLEVWEPIGLLILWILLLGAVSGWLFRRGLRLYTAAGM